MEVIRVIGTSILSAVVLFLLTKIMGEKQISQLSLFDYVTGITIGSIAAEMATELEKNPIDAIAAMSVYALLAFLISVSTSRSVKARKILNGRELILMDNGIIFRENMRIAKLDIADLQTLARISGYFNMSDIQTAVFEHNGSVSFLPRSSVRPVNPADMNLAPQQEHIIRNVILDGYIIDNNLKLCGIDREQLLLELKALGYNSASDVYLATCASDGKITAYPMKSSAPDGAGFN